MLKGFTLLFAVLVSVSALAKENADVMFMGTFHFANPGADVVKTGQINVMTEPNQAYLERLTTTISEAFAPTHVLLECDPSEQQNYETKFNSYLNNNFDLGSNENYQLGFRIGRKSKAKIICYDEREVVWDAQALMQWLANENGKVKASFDKTIQTITQEMEDMHKTMTLQQILVASNLPEEDVKNKALYIMLNDVGSGENFEGADAAASWWHRNFRMYANIQRQAQPGTRVFVIGGQGHTAILKDFLAMDPSRNAKSVMPLLLQ